MTTSPTLESVVRAAEIGVGTGRSRRFVGAEHDADVSYFYVENQPGEGPGLHWHPYSETWVVLHGTARITRGAETFDAMAGDTATVAGRVPHGFVNVGEEMLRILCIHASPIIIQTFLAEDGHPTGDTMSFQTYLDNIETKTGLTPRQFIALAKEQGFDESTKATPIMTWLKQEYGLGHGHAQAMVHVILKGPQISDKHVGRTGRHGDKSDMLWLDGKDSNPNA